MIQDRKDDARHKIQLGGLIIKAGMGDAEKLALYGGLVELADRRAFASPCAVLYVTCAFVPEAKPTTGLYTDPACSFVMAP